jgi:acyl carrier protein phosphodiesterase
VNFFGHLAVARRVDEDPAFLLGAMAPDLVRMCGVVTEPVASPKVAAGQRHHLEVDARFHDNPAFGGLCTLAARALVEAGLPRGPARGAAHVGIELFLDGLLSGDGPARAAYACCLAEAQAADASLVFADEPSRQRWRTLLARLRVATIPDDYRDPDCVAMRLVGTLSRRPRLALDRSAATVLRSFLPALKERVADQADELVAAAEGRHL